MHPLIVNKESDSGKNFSLQICIKILCIHIYKKGDSTIIFLYLVSLL